MSRLASFWHANWTGMLVIAGLVLAYVFLRARPTEIASVEDLLANLQRGTPTVVVFYSNA